ncbi:putative F-box domain, kelch-type beta propeller, F-box-like domain superfamily [Helianthus annuus]|nr:putative F-box domain, kelch-type beta propeller, F-box-like domain superfamily [Helianthus annuus]KAJ0922645.1 putative F-box domain, kelch-type beta propeller, F-box-like domain superfamily [Helianthus annuus]
MITENLTIETSLHEELEVLSVSKRLVRSLSQKLKRKNNEDDTSGISLRCPTKYTLGGGCKVGATTGEEYGETGCRRRSSSSVEEQKGYKPICRPEDMNVDCFSYGVKERFRKRSIRKVPEVECVDVFLPDDIVEMCLVRLPLTSLMKARLVCKKWRSLTTTPRFTQLRRNGLYQSPWMFLFGSVKGGFCSQEIHTYDVSLNKWHKIDSEVIKGRFLFSVVGIQENVYIVGGCSSLNNFGKLDRSSVKTHKGVLVFSPLTNSWRKVASMKHARSKPILGVYEVNSDSLTIKSQQSRQDRRMFRTRIGGVSDVYEDPHRLSVRRQLRYPVDESEVSYKPKNKDPSGKDSRRFLIMAAGGVGSWDEPLDSCEIYDSLSNKWTEIQRLPIDFGVICSGAFCNGMFYGYSETDNLAAYDIERGYWVRIQSTTLPGRVHEYYPKIISCEKRLFMVSVSWCEGDGQIGRRNKAVRKIWELDLLYLNWEEISIHPDAPMDWNATFVGDKNMIFGVEMFKIFGQVLDFLTTFNVSDVTKNWVHVSKNQVAHELDASSCMTKSVAVVHL